MPRLSHRPGVLAWAAVFLVAATVAYMAPVSLAFAQTSGVDVTSTVQDALGTIIAIGVSILIFVVRSWSQQHLGIQLDNSDWTLIQTALENSAHSFVNGYVLRGKPVIVDTKNDGANAVIAWISANYPAEVQRLGLTADALRPLAEGAVAKALNLTPMAPPYAAPATVAGAP